MRLKSPGLASELHAMGLRQTAGEPLVVQVVDRLARCGTTDLAASLAARLGPHGLRSEIWAVRAEGVEIPGLDPEAEREGARALAARGLSSRTVVLDARRPVAWRVLRLAAALRAGGVAVVHAHSRPADLWAVSAGLLARTPARLYSRQATYGGFSAANRLRYGLVSRLASRVVAVSGAVAEHLRRREGVAAARIARIHDGIELEALEGAAPARRTRARLGLEPGVPLLGCAAALTPRKGHASLLAAYAQLRRSHPRARLLLLGEGPERPKLERLARELGVAEGVLWLGFRADFRDLLAALDVFVLPSSWEGLNLSLLSACALGRAVVATHLRSNAEVVEHGVSGLLPTPRTPVLEAGRVDPGALAQACRTLLEDPQLRARLGRAAAARVRARFGADRMAARHAELYRRLLARAPRRAPLPADAC